MQLSVQLAPGNSRGLWLSNPVMTASGTFGYGIEYSEVFDIQRLGAVVCKGTTLKPRDGNPQPRLAETDAGMLNAIGLQNIGVEAVIREKAPAWAKWRVPVIVNIAGETADEYAEIARKLDGVPGVSGIEVNISCPNVKEGGAEFGTEPGPAGMLVSAVRKATSLPLMVKLTPNTHQIKDVAKAVAAAGADAVSLINTLKGMSLNAATGRPLLGNVTGGLSGPTIKPVALRMVYEVAGLVDVPVVGCGGISNAQDAIEFIMAGASAVQVGTATFIHPTATLDIIDSIGRYMQEKQIEDIAELVGMARK